MSKYNFSLLVKLTLLTLLTLKVPMALADDEGEISDDDFYYCEITETAMNDYEPEKFEPSNNMLRKAGQNPIFCGESIIVYGRILDQNCIPVTDAKVYAWQADCSGHYPYTPLKENAVDDNLIEITPENSFTGNGTARTNNNGEFHFVTVYPPEMHGYGPHLNVRVEHFELGTLQARLVLKNHQSKNPILDPELQSIAKSADKRGLKIYKFELVLPGAVDKNYD